MRWVSILILVFILWVKWLFWLRRWKEVLHVYIHNLELNLIPNQIALYNSLFIIMGIILHDVLQKTIKIFYFSRFKPSSLQFTPTQLLSAAMDSLLGLFDNICTIYSKVKYSRRKRRKYGQKDIFLRTYTFCESTISLEDVHAADAK